MANPIDALMRITMENLKEMIDVDTVVGTPVAAGGGLTIIPISKVGFGFVTGGGEYVGASGAGRAQGQQTAGQELPFAGGASAGVSVTPIGFLVVGADSVRLIPAQTYHTLDKIIELTPQLIKELKKAFTSDDSQQSMC